MAVPLELDGSALSGSDGRDLLRFKVSADNANGVIYIQSGNAGRLGLSVWDESHAQWGNVSGHAIDAQAAGGFTITGTRIAFDDGYLRITAPVAGSASFSIGHHGTDDAIYVDASAVSFRVLAGSPERATLDSGGLRILYGGASRLTLLSSNTDYGWRIETVDNGGGDVPLNIYRRTGGSDTLVADIDNRTGVLQVMPIISNGAKIAAFSASNSYGLSLAGTQDNGGASSIFHNADAYYNSSGAATLKWRVTHSSFGSRGIWFDYTGGGAGMPGAGGIAFYADNASATAGSSFTPTLRLVIQNDGPVVAYGPSLTVLRSGADPSLEVRRLGTASALMVVGGVDYVGTNSDSALKPYARIRAIAESHISLAEYGRLYFYVMVNGTEQNMMEVRDTGLWLKNTTTLLYTAGMTNFAGANTGTLTNAPAAGNPTKWIQINDGGVLRKIPTW